MERKPPTPKLPEIAVRPLVHADHPWPVTRRQLLGQGFLGCVGLSMLPRFFGAKAYAAAADCAGGATASEIPFLVFDMAGGAALPANFLVGKAGDPQNLLAAYDLLGWDPRAAGALFTGFGLPMAANLSGILKGIQATASAEAQANLRLGSICHIGQDDSTVNRLSAVTLVTKAGATGLFMTNGLGGVDSTSGGNSDAALQDATLKPTYVTSINDILGSVNFGGTSFHDLRAAETQAVAAAAYRLAGIQATRWGQRAGADVLAQLSNCSYKKGSDLASGAGASGVDPRADTIFSQVYQLTAATAPDDANAMAAAITMNCLRGNSGPGVWTLGGCDYHDGTQTTGDAQDLAMGTQIGRAVEAAKQLGKPLFFQLITDGGIAPDQGTRTWRSDAGDKSMTVLGFYHPKAAPAQPRKQVGAYTDGQGADQSTLIGGTPLKASYAAFANYLNVLGRIDDFETFVPGVFSKDDLQSLLLFTGVS